MSTVYHSGAIRFQKSYRADVLTPVTGAYAGAVAAYNALQDEPWKIVTSPIVAVLTPHDTVAAGEPANLDHYDAYELCGEHASGQHRIYAGVAAYRITLPDTAIGLTLESVSASVLTDAYNRYGARVALATSAQTLPSSTWLDCREGAAHADGLAPRTISADGLKWYGATATATLAPAGGLVLAKYLYVYVSLENYLRSRNGWLEGSALIVPEFTLTLASAITGYAAGADLAGGYASSAVTLSVAGAAVAPLKTGSTASTWPEISYKFTEAHGAFRRINTTTFSTAAKIAGCARQLVAGAPGNVTSAATVYSRAVEADVVARLIPSVRGSLDAGWSDYQYGLAAGVALTAGTPGWLFLTASYYLIPFTLPGFTPKVLTLTNGASPLSLNGARVQITPWLVPAPGDLSNAVKTQWFIMQSLARQGAFWLGSSASLSGSVTDLSSTPVTFNATATRLAPPSVFPDVLAAADSFRINLSVTPAAAGFIVLAAWVADAGASLSTSLTQVGLSTLKVLETGEVAGAGWLPAVTID